MFWVLAIVIYWACRGHCDARCTTIAVMEEYNLTVISVPSSKTELPVYIDPIDKKIAVEDSGDQETAPTKLALLLFFIHFLCLIKLFLS